MRILAQKLETVAVGRIKPHPRNPNQGDVSGIQESIQANGFFDPILVQKSTGYIVSGNHRFLAALEEGADKVPVVWLDVGDDEALRLMLAANRFAERASRHPGKLAELLEEIEATDAGLLGTGYDGEDLTALLKSIQGIGPEADPLPPMEEEEAPVEPAPKSQFVVYVDCPDEASQDSLLERLTEEGYSCRALTS